MREGQARLPRTYLLALMGAEVVKIERPGRGALARRPGTDGPQPVTRTGFYFADRNPAPQGLAPALSTDTDRWLGQPGYGVAEIARLRGRGTL